jgi:hypothetical protein
MLPYNQLTQPTAAPTGRQGDTSGAVKGLGERCLSLNPVFDWSNPHHEKVRDPLHINGHGRSRCCNLWRLDVCPCLVHLCDGWQAFLEIDRLLQVPSLQATPIGATPLITFIHVKKTIRAQVKASKTLAMKHLGTIER